MHGSFDGLQFSDEYTITEGNLGGTLGLRETAQFGTKLTINDFDGDGLDDLAISSSTSINHVPLDQISVSVIYQQDHDGIFVNGFDG